jgi:hypothetical protein
MTFRAWYCGRCRRVLKAEPKWAVEKGCKCPIPQLPKSSTLIHDFSRTTA